MTEDFATYIDGERARLAQKHADLVREMKRLDLEIHDVDREFDAIDAYESAKTGKTQTVRNRVSAHARTVRRGDRREAILNALCVSPLGMTRSELLEKVGVKGDKTGEMSISNALSNMQKAGIVARDDESRRWYMVTQLQQAAE